MYVVGVFWNKKKFGPNKGNPLNSSIDKIHVFKKKKRFIKGEKNRIHYQPKFNRENK